MKIFLWGTALLLISFVLHLLIWKVRLPRKHTRGLVLIFYGTFSVWFCFVIIYTIFGFKWEVDIAFRPEEYVHIFLYYCAVTFVYIGGYTLLEVDSPSLLIIDKIHASGDEGLSKERLYALLNDDVLVVPRINDLTRDEMATLENGTYKIMDKYSWRLL